MKKLSEVVVDQQVMLEAPKHAVQLYRNNVGATPAKAEHCCPRCKHRFAVHQRPVRYGLANISSQMNKEFKSGDRIGWTLVQITPEMVGSITAVFTSYEIKHSHWVYTGKGREHAQNNWAEHVRRYGGIAKFVTCVEDIWPD